ncbi:MAG: sel1 repeat family protein [Deltaproteobacteria bacterium]|nr:sel1 repeat family protein [Deltaproteobacteria bacterium]
MAMRVSVLLTLSKIVFMLAISAFMGCSSPHQAEVEIAADVTIDAELSPLADAEATVEVASQRDLGRQYAKGEGVEQDYDQAFSLIEQAAEKGLVEAQVALGRLYSRRKKEAQDYAAARLWFQRAARQGSTQAMEAIALMCVRGQGGVESYGQAAEWLRLAVGAGSLGATYSLANYYMEGLGVEQDTEMGMDLLKQSASLGYGYSIDYLVREAQRNNVDAQDFLCNLVVGPEFDTELWQSYRSTLDE